MREAKRLESSKVVRVKVSATIDENLVRWMDDLIERGLFRNRSHLVEEALKHVKKEGIKEILMEKLEKG